MNDRFFHSTRRGALQGVSALLGATMLPGRTAASSAPSPAAMVDIDLPQLAYGGTWNPREGAMEELAREVRLRSRLEPRAATSVVRPGEASLFDTPFLYVAGARALPDLEPAALRQLRQFIDLGGLLVFDDATGGTDAAFRDSVFAMLGAITPDEQPRPVSPDHVLFRSFYLVDRPYGRTDFGHDLLGVHDTGRLKVLLIPCDLGGALCRDIRGGYQYPCNPGGPTQREEAIRFGINIVLYATCTDYKSDRAHVETLEETRRRR